MPENLLKKLVAWIDENTDGPSDSLTGPNSLKISPNFIRYTAGIDSANLSEYGAAIDKYLLTLGADEWREAIEEESTALDRLILRIETGNFAPKAIPFREAISGHLADLAKGRDVATPDSERWAIMLKGVKAKSFNPLVKEVCTSLNGITVTGEGASRVARAVPSLVTTALEGEGRGVVFEKIIAPLIHADLQLAASIVAKANLSEQSSLSPTEREMVISAIEDAVRGEPSEEDKKLLGQISEQLKLPWPIEEPAEDPASTTSAD